MGRSDVLALFISLLGSGGIVMWILQRKALKNDRNNKTEKSLVALQKQMEQIQDGLVMALENDKVIFKALRTHEINGESEHQEEKMDSYFLSLIKDKNKHD